MSGAGGLPGDGPDARVLMAHGGGGRLMHRLIDAVIGPAVGGPALDLRHDGAVLPAPGRRLAFTTDSYVVRPIEFPGGDIGSLAVAGTVNDLAMCGARPLHLSLSLILEEGLPLEVLRRVLASAGAMARRAGVSIVTGDTKVVERRGGDGLFMNTAGIGEVVSPTPIHPDSVREGDAILVSGDIARHGVAVMSVREGLGFGSVVESDAAPLAAPVLGLLEAGVPVRCLRDLTRGGLAAALIEIAEAGRWRFHVDEATVPLCEGVRGACELLGLDPFSVACEGRFIAFVPEDAAAEALERLRRDPVSAGAARIGRVTGHDGRGLVVRRSVVGTDTILDMPAGEQLPRIC